jgi:hypothetical protein
MLMLLFVFFFFLLLSRLQLTCISSPVKALSETPSNARACLSSPADWSQSATEDMVVKKK